MGLRGWFVRGESATVLEGRRERRLLCAVLLRAVEDARRGDVEAAAWLEDTGRAWCALLGIPADDWPAAGSRLQDARRELLPDDDAERFRRYRAARKDDPVYQERERARQQRSNEKRRAERAKKRT
jgi:hypothetical protein